MTTKIYEPTEENIKRAAELIKSGETVAFPTETVYGLGANAYDAEAVKKIFAAKGRPADNPLIVHISDMEMLKGITSEVPEYAFRLADKFWPGPLTMIMPKSQKIPHVTSGGLDTVGVRFPSNPVAKELIRLSGLPIAAPSANSSGRPSPTNAGRVYEDMSGKIPAIIDGGECDIGLESTVIALSGNKVTVLRPGKVTAEMISEVLPEADVSVDEAVSKEVAKDAVVASPGMKYKHYAPKADVIILKGSREAYREYVRRHCGDGVFCLLYDESDSIDGVPYICWGSTHEEQAKKLFEVLREFDEKGAKRVYAMCPDTDGIGLAVYNRILRAAGFSVLEV